MPTRKLEKARIIVESALVATSLFLIVLQRITGFRNFVTIVVPLGRTFLRRLYNMELHFRSTKRREGIAGDGSLEKHTKT